MIIFSKVKSQKLKVKNLEAQALVTLLVFVAVAMTITAGATTVTLINSQATGKFAQGEEALRIAEAGADNALLRVLRDPGNLYLWESLPVGAGNATITVSGTTTKTIDSVGTTGNFSRKIRVVGSWSGNAFAVSSWSEID